MFKTAIIYDVPKLTTCSHHRLACGGWSMPPVVPPASARECDCIHIIAASVHVVVWGPALATQVPTRHFPLHRYAGMNISIASILYFSTFYSFIYFIIDCFIQYTYSWFDRACFLAGVSDVRAQRRCARLLASTVPHSVIPDRPLCQFRLQSVLPGHIRCCDQVPCIPRISRGARVVHDKPDCSRCSAGCRPRDCLTQCFYDRGRTRNAGNGEKQAAKSAHDRRSEQYMMIYLIASWLPGSKIFNESAKKGIAYFQEHKILSDPIDILQVSFHGFTVVLIISCTL